MDPFATMPLRPLVDDPDVRRWARLEGVAVPRARPRPRRPSRPVVPGLPRWARRVPR